MKKVLDMVVRSNEQVNYQNHLLKITPASGEKLPDMYPGQFVQIRVQNSPSTFLRRPISVNLTDTVNNECWLLVQKVGEGTRHICDARPGDVINTLLPLGNSFTLPEDNGANILLVGGGVGMAPMLFLGTKAKEKGFSPDFLLGGRSEKDLLQLEYFSKLGTLYATTEDGSYGEKGFVTHHSVLRREKYDFIYTCGPKPMMVAVAKYAKENNIECEASLENLMACGFGACLCCIEKTTRGNLCACTDGPVFNIRELSWTD